MIKKTTARFFALSILLSLCSIAVQAQAKAHAIDKNHSQINFIAEARLISAHGRFGTFDAEVMLDPAKIENSSVKITIEAKSIDTQSNQRDTHLRSKDFFDVEKFPQITFVSKKITKVNETNYKVVGDMTMRGVTKEVTIPLTKVFYENNIGRFKGTFEINRTEYGMTYNSMMNKIDDIVKIELDFTVRAK